MRIRVLPVVLAVAMLTVILKLVQMVMPGQDIGAAAFWQGVFAPVSHAQSEKPAEEDETEPPQEVVISPGAPSAPQKFSPGDTSKMEKELLQSLVKRREELQSWEQSILLKENLLRATEQKVDKKMTELETLKQEVSTLLSQYNDKETANIRSLVKIYENMKPKDAAAIFDDMDMHILLRVIDHMKEKNAAPILSKMNPEKARRITVELAQQRELPSDLSKGN